MILKVLRHPRIALSAASLLVAAVGYVVRAWTAPPKPDPEMQDVLDALSSLGPRPLAELTPAQARQQPGPADAVKLMLKHGSHGSAPRVPVTTRNIIVEGATGPLPARLYIPRTSAAEQTLPVILYFHGGGWVIADIDTYDASARALAALSGAIVLSSHYRQAPEHRFPAAHDDAFAVYQWLIANADSFDGDSSRIAVAGESAGANLAAHVSIRARDAGIQAPLHQLLVYPVAGADMQNLSYRRNAEAQPLSKAGMQWFIQQVFDDPDQTQDPRISLVDARLQGLPPTTLITAEIDPLQSEGSLLAIRLKAAGVQVEALLCRGVTHEFFGMGAVLDKARDAQAFASGALRDALGLTIASHSHDQPPVAA